MAYQSLYLTYRPQTFNEIAGQKPIVHTLQNALKYNKIAHAYLFAGPRGTGKTTMARLFAKALNCEQGVGNQCCECSNCLSVKEGNHPDVIEVDAASNNGVEQVRQLIDKVSYSPIKGQYKVYIIDEVHMMTTGAFNALLKTLEEPPANVIFILCTTEPHKVLPTIVSRCQRFDFAKLNEVDMTQKLIEVLELEKAQYTKEGIKTVVNIADGGMRDALSILDQVLAYSDNKLEEKDVLDIFGLASTIEKVTLLKALSNGDVKKVIDSEQMYAKKGIDIRRLTTDLISICKDEIVYIKTKQPSLLTDINEETAKDLEGYFSLIQLSKLISILLEAQNNYRFTNDIRTLFDLSLIKYISVVSNEIIEEHPQIRAKKSEPKKQEEESSHYSQSQVESKPNTPKLNVKKQESQLRPFEEVYPEKCYPSISKTINEKEINKTVREQNTNEPPSFLFEDTAKLNNKSFVKFEAKPKNKEMKMEKKVERATTNEQPSVSTQLPKLSKPNIAISGPNYTLEEKTLVDIVCLGREHSYIEKRKRLLVNWVRFNDLKLHQELGSFANLLSQGKPFVYCKSVLLLTYDFENLAKKANIKENQESLSKMVEQLCGEKLFIYALGPNERSSTLEAFYNLMRIGQLPNNKDITLSLPKDL